MAKTGEIIRLLRIKRGLSQARLAELMGLRRSAIGNYERGFREPDLDTVDAFADFFDVSVDDLLGREDAEPDKNEPKPPKTTEARIISAGVDKMSPEERKRILQIFELLFEQDKDKFTGGDDDDS